METSTADEINTNVAKTSETNNFVEVTSNWQISNNRDFCNAITTVTLSEASDRINLEEVVSFETCIALKAPENENNPCILDVKVKSCQKIARITVVSEACVLEFFKECGEYATTTFAEFVDEFEGNSVYFAEASIEPPTTEASIKFTKIKSKGPVMWIYGIKLVLTESSEKNDMGMFNYDIIRDFLFKSSGSKQKGIDITNKILASLSLEKRLDNTDSCSDRLNIPNSILSHHTTKDETEVESTLPTNVLETVDLKKYIDNKLQQMEERLMQKLNKIEENTNQRIDIILKILESKLNVE